MEDFFKYISASEEDKDWGLYLNVAGKSKVPSGISYPSAEHPSGYHFSWDKGRTLNEYQINYITKGTGTLENARGKFAVKPGSLLIIRKGEWHRYRPNKNEGWLEHYIGFDGMFANHFLQENQILQGQSVIHCGVREDFIDTYYKIFELVRNEDPGNQHIAAGLVIKLLGCIVAWEKQKNFSGKPIEKLIQEARFYMREHIEEEVDLQKLAEDNCIGYSYFRKMFKKYTGISPHQYHLDLKIMRSKELILTTNKSMKEISYELGFQSIHYFSRIFKKKVGQNPSELRGTVTK
ncbi:AraC family transcriptional regulator [Labilibaculum euxinus]|uniref:AraC family transcriptional regulator n=1 Tax=Labilibaculum euxinus TaxID=2686357 RepID=A0A7M4D1Z5_9BACT|nr:AraC family transcriptional regulator [Labilibaculum euxinus]MUP36674.1 AraC family transcriptional regulator [Labilibaculum euxinus]MVB05879.1 AraC family transcriptional regulator [Labilibaculum euxinus]